MHMQCVRQKLVLLSVMVSIIGITHLVSSPCFHCLTCMCCVGVYAASLKDKLRDEIKVLFFNSY